MKSPFAPLAYSLIFFALGAPAQETKPSAPYLEVIGTATEQTPVDRVVWSLRIRQVSPTVSEAGTAIGESYTRLKSELTKLGLKNDQIRVAEVSSGREFEMSDRTRKFIGFFAERNVNVTLIDLAKVQAVQEALLRDDLVSVQGVFRDSSERLELRKNALRSAARAASEKARELAATLGVQVGNPLQVTEEGSRGMSNITSNGIQQPIFSDRPVMDLDAVSTTCSVTVRFEIIKK